MDQSPSQLDRIEDRIELLWMRVDNIEKRVGAWGAFGAALTMVLSRLAGCI